MEVYYKPSLLMKVRAEVEQKHIGKKKLDYKNDNVEFREFVKLVEKWKESKVAQSAELLEPEQVTYLAGYVSNNRYNVKCKNHLKVIALKGTKEDMKLLFTEWQNHYKNNEVREALKDMVVSSELFCTMLNEMDVCKGQVQEWIKEKNIVYAVIKECNGIEQTNTFFDLLHRQGIIRDTCLFTECENKFYLVCGAKAYLDAGDKRIEVTFCHCENDDDRRMLIKNVLERLTLHQLVDFPCLYKEIKRRKINKNIIDDKWLESFSLKKKYEQWGLLVDLGQSMEDSVRIEFWLKYILGGQISFGYNKESIYMEFGDYIITEFKQKAAGPAYFYEKSEYEKNIKWKQRGMAKSKFQIFEYQYWQKHKDTVLRLEHRPEVGWQSEFSYQLRNRYGILPTEYN